MGEKQPANNNERGASHVARSLVEYGVHPSRVSEILAARAQIIQERRKTIRTVK